MGSLGGVVLVQVLFLSESQTTRRKASRLDSIFQIRNDLLVLALFLHSRPPLILLHCTFFSFLAMSRVFLSFTSRGTCGILPSLILFLNQRANKCGCDSFFGTFFSLKQNVYFYLGLVCFKKFSC